VNEFGAFVASCDVVADDAALCLDARAPDSTGAAEAVHAEAEVGHANRQRDEREEPFAFHVVCDACGGVSVACALGWLPPMNL
jgi:hypothetical protein